MSRELHDLSREWNDHKIRKSKQAPGPFGKPNINFYAHPGKMHTHLDINMIKTMLRNIKNSSLLDTYP